MTTPASCGGQCGLSRERGGSRRARVHDGAILTGLAYVFLDEVLRDRPVKSHIQRNPELELSPALPPAGRGREPKGRGRQRHGNRQ